MSFTNHTPNYNLPQYVGTDKPTFLGDFNNAMSAIDTALHNNEQNAGEGLAELQQAQAALTETQETLTEVQTEVANVSGIAATVNENVQQALSAANDATTAANSATSQIQPAVTAANQASADAQAAQQVANGNISTLNSLSERVTALESTANLPLVFNSGYQGNSGSNIYPHNFTDLDPNTEYYFILITEYNDNSPQLTYSGADEGAVVEDADSKINIQYPNTYVKKVTKTSKITWSFHLRETNSGWSWLYFYKGKTE